MSKPEITLSDFVKCLEKSLEVVGFENMDTPGLTPGGAIQGMSFILLGIVHEAALGRYLASPANFVEMERRGA